MYRSVLQQTAPLTVVAAQWSAGGAACKEEDLGHQASVGGRLWKPLVGGGLLTLEPSVGAGAKKGASRPSVERGENSNNHYLQRRNTNEKS